MSRMLKLRWMIKMMLKLVVDKYLAIKMFIEITLVSKIIPFHEGNLLLHRHIF